MRASPPKAASTVEALQPHIVLHPPTVTLDTCGHHTGELSFCNVTYPIRDYGDSASLQYTDSVAQNYFEEYRQSGASSTCLAATKSLVCSRFFPRCTFSTEGDGYMSLLPCQSICSWLHDYECPGAEQSNCSLVNCPAEFEQRGDRCFASDACTAYPTLASNFASPPPALSPPPSPPPPSPPLPPPSPPPSPLGGGGAAAHTRISTSSSPSPEPSIAAANASAARRTPQAISQELSRLALRIKRSSKSESHSGAEDAAGRYLAAAAFEVEAGALGTDLDALY